MLALLIAGALASPLGDLASLAPAARVEVPFDRTVREATPVTGVHSDGSAWVALISSRPDALEIAWYDDALQPADTTLVELPNRASLAAWTQDDDAWFLAFHGEGRRDFWLVEVPLRPGPIGVQSFLSPRAIKVDQVVVDGALLAVRGRSVTREVVVHGRLETPEQLAELLLPGLPRVLDVGRLHAVEGGVDLLVAARGGRRDRWLAHLDGSGFSVAHALPRSPDSPRLVDAERLASPEGELLVGIYSDPRSAGVAGLYAAGLNREGVQWEQTHPFLDLEGFYAYLPEGRIDRAKRRGRRRLARGRAGLPYVFVLHELLPLGEDAVLVAEAYEPEFRTETRTETTLINGRVVTRQVTTQVFVGWRAVLALATALDGEGQLRWSHTLATRGLYPTLDERVAVAVDSALRVSLTHVDQARLAHLTVDASGERALEERRITGESVRGAWQTGADPWGEAFLVWGMQRVADAQGKRRVFAMSRVLPPDLRGD